MSREVKRVPIGFDWPMYKTWWGYALERVSCQTCNGSGKASPHLIEGYLRGNGTWHIFQAGYCPTCEGEGKKRPKIDVPTGPGYQLWEMATEGSPISPVFATPEELARWLDHDGLAVGYLSVDYETLLMFIVETGGSPATIPNHQDPIPGEYSKKDSNQSG
jgi:hypothetical protein